MAKRFKVLLGLVTAFVLTLSIGVFAACGDKDKDKIALESIAFENDAIELEAGKSVQLTVICTPTDATNKKVTYESDDEAVCTVNESGLVTAKADADGSTCVITATAEEGDGLITAECGITVIPDKGEAIAKTATLKTAAGDVTNNLTLYTRGRIELHATAVTAAIALPLDEDYVGTYSIKDNALSFKGSAKAMGFSFPVLSGVTFKNQQMQLRLYINNGSADFELGTYEFTKEEAAKLVGTTDVAGGIDTTKPYIMTTISTAKDSVELWSDGKAKFSIGTYIPEKSTVKPIAFEATWKKGATANTVEFTPPSGAVNTKGHVVPGYSILGVTVPEMPFADTSTVAIAAATDTKNGVTISVTFSWKVGEETKTAPVTLNLARERANSVFDFTIPYIKTESITFGTDVATENGKKTLALVSGGGYDFYEKSTLNVASGVTDLPSALGLTIALKDDTQAKDVVTISSNTVTGLKAGKVVVTVSVDDVKEDIEITVSYPDGKFTDAVKVAEAITFENTTDGTTLSYTFGADGLFYFEAAMGTTPLFRSYGYYNLKLTGDTPTIELQYFNALVGLLYGQNFLTGTASYAAEVESGKMVSFTIVLQDDDGEDVTTKFTPKA